MPAVSRHSADGGGGAVLRPDRIRYSGRRSAVRLTLRMTKDGAVLYEGTHDVVDAVTFARPVPMRG